MITRFQWALMSEYFLVSPHWSVFIVVALYVFEGAVHMS